MQPRIWVYSIALTFSWLTSPVLAGEPVNFPYILAQNNTKAQPIAVNKVEFGVLRVDKGGKVTLIPTNKVPLLEGTVYGWRVQLRDYQGEVTWREVFQLPQRPETWGTTNTDNFSLSTDGTAAETKRTDLTKDGVITNSWTIAAGDPMGKHIIEVYIDDRRIAAFEFEVVPVRQQRPVSAPRI
ncbi:hypothetical protein [Fischerella sp. PCC 9605]|uniref:hypothetical protein n=1 Tax=Fischerella sp. PCC 9605 TaxID=1173024 RepID=UPI00047B80C5|nr:hypothetical protein [Fischerella sp. PCC 9605]